MIPTDELIFFRGVETETTNQLWYFMGIFDGISRGCLPSTMGDSPSMATYHHLFFGKGEIWVVDDEAYGL